MAASKSISEVLSKVLTKATERHQQLLEIQHRWERFAGKALAKHTKVVAVRRGTLYVQSDEPGSSYAVHLEKTKLLERLNAGESRRIEEIVIRAGSA